MNDFEPTVKLNVKPQPIWLWFFSLGHACVLWAPWLSAAHVWVCVLVDIGACASLARCVWRHTASARRIRHIVWRRDGQWWVKTAHSPLTEARLKQYYRAGPCLILCFAYYPAVLLWRRYDDDALRQLCIRLTYSTVEHESRSIAAQIKAVTMRDKYR